MSRSAHAGSRTRGAVGRRVALLTGFEPFGGDRLNPSALAVRALHGRQVASHRIVGLVLPTRFAEAALVLRAALGRHRPAVVIATGLAGGRTGLSLERVAVNLDDARIPDNGGAQPVDMPVVKGGPAAYFSTLPLKAMRAALRAEGLPAKLSHTAGTFVCNHAFYALMHALARRRGVPAGFIHLPWLPEMGSPAMPLDDQVRGLRLALQVALTHQGPDLRVAGGTVA